MNDPFRLFQTWYEEAKTTNLRYPNAMALATVDKNHVPSVRIVLMKHFDQNGIVFYTNLESHKSQDIKATGMASVCFHWDALQKQVRVTGHVTPVSNEEADAYFASRPRDSQISAWASDQSKVMATRDVYEDRFKEFTKKFEGGEVPRPEGWSGWRIAPERIEFWVEKPFRRHDRHVFIRQGDQSFREELLYP